MSTEYWSTNNVAGSGTLWNTGLVEPGVNRNMRAFDAETIRNSFTDGVVYAPYIPLTSSAPNIGGTDLNRMNDYKVSQFFYDWTMVRKPNMIQLDIPDDDTDLRDILSFVDNFCNKHMLATKEEVKEYEDAAINNKVHSIFKKLLK